MEWLATGSAAMVVSGMDMDCCLCDQGFESWESLAKHIYRVHAEGGWSKKGTFRLSSDELIVCCCGRPLALDGGVFYTASFATHLEAKGGMAAHLAECIFSPAK